MRKPSLVPMTISRNQVLERYWVLANLDPDTTKGSITGQLKALDALCEELAAVSGEARPPRPSGVYRSAWMAETDLEQ